MTKINKVKPLLSRDFYFIARFNVQKDILWALLITIPVSLIYNYLTLYDTSKTLSVNAINIRYISIIVSSFVSFIFTFVFRTIFINNLKLNNKIIKGHFGIGKEFFDLIRNILYDLDNIDEREKDKKIRETSYFLKTNNSRTGKTLQFDPDNRAINQLHKAKGLISVTEASPSEWLNPTYNFFLINNYVASISQSISKNAPVNSVKFSANRNEAKFIAFENSKKEVLKKLSELTLENNLIKFLDQNKIFIRFYILKEDEIASNRSIIETLIAGHDLFGCYVYFINHKVMSDLMQQDVENERFMTFIKSINYNLDENNDKIDLAVALTDSKLEVIYRKEDDLNIQELDDFNSIEFQSYIKKLSSLLYHNYDQSSHLFDSYFKKNGFTLNNEYCHIIYN